MSNTEPDAAMTQGAWAEFSGTPLRLRLYLGAVAVVALVAPVVLNGSVPAPSPSTWLTVTALLVVSVLNVEVSRQLTGGLARTDQPHKALSAWAFATALLLPTNWLLVVVPVTYAHARWRGIRVPLWKWIGSGLYLILCGVVAALIRHQLLGDQVNWMDGDGRRGFVTMLAAGAAFLALEALLFAGSAVLNHAEDEQWLRTTLRSPSFYLTESSVLVIGGLFSAIWTAGPWYTLLLVPIYILVQHAVLLAPLRERAAAAAELATKNRELARINEHLGATNDELSQVSRLKTDLIGMLGHEIGNPLTSVIGYTQLGLDALETGDPEATRAALTVVERNAHHVAAVLTDIVQLVAADSRQLTATPEQLLLEPRLQAAVEQLPLDQRPEIRCPSDLSAYVQPAHLDQILANLLSNADKYADGATRVEARLHHTGHVEIAVIDQGPGIPDTFQADLFERYRRGEPTAATVAGTGIGLFISRELARANRGELVHRPGPGPGACFVLALPKDRTSEPVDSRTL